MNSQLYAHIEAYDSYDDSKKDDDADSSPSSRSPAGADDEVESREGSQDKKEKKHFMIEIAISCVPFLILPLESLFFEEKSVGLLPVALISFVWLVYWQQWRSSSPPQREDSSQLMHAAKKEGDTLTRQTLSSEISVESKTDNSGMEQYLYEWRNELSRLLGLVGAPPLGERNRLSYQEDGVRPENFDIPTNNEYDHIVNEINDGTDPLDLSSFSSKKCVDDVTTSVISFLEAHVQVVLTIDKALYWMRITSSLHWGLGPHSQCVERVERASMSKELFLIRRRTADRQGNTNDATEMNNISSDKLAPKSQTEQAMNKIGSSSILALSSARRNIADIIVDEAQSIVETLSIISECVAQERRRTRSVFCSHTGADISDEANSSDFNDAGFGENGHDNNYIFHCRLLELPDVIDISWMKASRKHLAYLLTCIADQFSTWEYFKTLVALCDDNHKPPSSSATKPLRVLNESMWKARNLKEYLTSHLLLDDDKSSISLRSFRPITRSVGVDDDFDFLLSLSRYQQQLDALHAVLWSGRVDSTSSDISCAGAKKDFVPQRMPSSKLMWWNQVQQISATCQSMEREIGKRFFSSPDNDHTRNKEANRDCSDQLSSLSDNKSVNSCQTQSYEHTENGKPTNTAQRKNLMTTKTLVFSGEGSKEKLRRKRKQKVTTDNDSGSKLQTEENLANTPIPSIRDPFAEQLLVRELQTRIRSVAMLREEEHQLNYQQQDMYGIDEQQSSSETKVAEEIIDNDSITCSDEDFVPRNDVKVRTDEMDSRERELSTHIFLGASGSLLDELKRNICQDQVVPNPNEILETDKSVADTTDDDLLT